MQTNLKVLSDALAMEIGRTVGNSVVRTAANAVYAQQQAVPVPGL